MDFKVFGNKMKKALYLVLKNRVLWARSPTSP